MEICIVGGKLQGLEVTYLSKKGRHYTVLIDKKSDVPSVPLVDEFHNLDVLTDVNEVKKVLRDVDAVLPACEDLLSLIKLEELCNELGVPFMQDNSAFRITSDKVLSQQFFERNEIPIPEPWPKASFPLIVKPARKSGSVGIHKVENEHQLKRAIEAVQLIDDKAVIQEFVDGPALSLEVIALGGDPVPLEITQLEFDETFGCKRVFTPDLTNDEARKRFAEISREVAKGLQLTGLMDVQALVDLSTNTPKVNEINARLPSQTPTVVYHSTNVNMVNLLIEIFVKNRLPNVELKFRKAVIYQHVRIENRVMHVVGEHVMAHARDLEIKEDFMGLDEAITNVKRGKEIEGKVMTMIVKDQSLEDAWIKLNNAIEEVRRRLQIRKIIDISPFKAAVFKLS